MTERKRAVADVVKSMLDFYKGKRVFITGHTGFKGSWLCAMLSMAGAQVTGFALPPEHPSLHEAAGLEEKISHFYGDIRDFDPLWTAFQKAKPEIVFHMAAQPIVRESYRDPVGTYQTNVMGTVHILECVRRSGCVKSLLNVTTDKVYENRNWPWGYREKDRLNGFDPYSNSKSCSELVTDSYRNSFFSGQDTAISTARAGNVFCGGDFAADRIIPDCICYAQAHKPIPIRNPDSIRPYQHVLEPLSAYLLIAQRQYEDHTLAGCYNVGPENCGCLTTGALASLFCQVWGDGACWERAGETGPHEDALLKLDCSKITAVLGWRPRWTAARAIEETVNWTKAWMDGADLTVFMEKQIERFLGEQYGTIH